MCVLLVHCHTPLLKGEAMAEHTDLEVWCPDCLKWIEVGPQGLFVLSETAMDPRELQHRRRADDPKD